MSPARTPARRPGARAALPVAALLLSGCAALGLGRSEPAGADRRLTMASALMEAGSYARAETILRLLASRCENGADGRRGLLLLTSLFLDPRNPAAAPDSAALMAARFLGLPDSEAPERPLAEALYALALDVGADPGLRPDREADRDVLAERFSDCGDAAAPAQPMVLPTLEREPLARQLVRLRHERDSLATAPTSGAADPLRQQNRALQGRVTELEAELERIRRLLGGRDTTSLEPRRR